MTVIDWSSRMKFLRKGLETLKTGDRLQTTSNIHAYLSALQTSLNGWLEWVTNPEVMSQFSQGELDEIYEFFKTQTFTIVDEDIKWTVKKSKDFAKKAKKSKKKKSKTELKYVS